MEKTRKKCPAAAALEVVGKPWALLIVRDMLLDGPQRFQGLLNSLEGVSPNTLSARLKTLEEYGVIERRFYDQHPPRAEYLLTQRGKSLRPVIRELLKWGRQLHAT